MPQVVGKSILITVGPQHGLPGTPGYRPPEYNDGHYSTLSDVYGYGVVRCTYSIPHHLGSMTLCPYLYMQVVLETFTGLLAYSGERKDQSGMCLPSDFVMHWGSTYKALKASVYLYCVD